MHLGNREKFISVTESTVHRLRSVSKGKVRGAEDGASKAAFNRWEVVQSVDSRLGIDAIQR
jgi:hypothetical protein